MTRPSGARPATSVSPVPVGATTRPKASSWASCSVSSRTGKSPAAASESSVIANRSARASSESASATSNGPTAVRRSAVR